MAVAKIYEVLKRPEMKTELWILTISVNINFGKALEYFFLLHVSKRLWKTSSWTKSLQGFLETYSWLIFYHDKA